MLSKIILMAKTKRKKNLKIQMLAGNPVNSWFSAGSQISLTLGKVLDFFDFLTICSFLIDNDSKWSGPVDNYQMTWVVPFFFSSEYSTMHMPSLLMKCADTTYKHTCENQMRELAAPWSHSTNKVLLYCLLDGTIWRIVVVCVVLTYF